MEGQPAYENAPRSVLFDAFDFEGDQPPDDVLEQALPDAYHDVGPVDCVVDWQDRGSLIPGNAEMAVEVLSRSDGEQLPALRHAEHIRTSLVNPHATILHYGRAGRSGPKVPQEMGFPASEALRPYYDVGGLLTLGTDGRSAIGAILDGQRNQT